LNALRCLQCSLWMVRQGQACVLDMSAPLSGNS